MRYLVDTSVLARARQDIVGNRLTTLAQAGHLWTCRLIDLEIAYASRARDVADVIEERRRTEVPVDWPGIGPGFGLGRMIRFF